MTLKVVGNVGKADRETTVEDVMGDAPKTGARYLDLRTGDLLVEKTKAPAPEPDAQRKYTEDELNAMRMSELRRIGRPLGAKDTKKSELIAEILELQ